MQPSSKPYVPLAWSGAGYIRWIFEYCSNRLDILRSRASAKGSAKSPRKFRLRSGVDDVTLTVELSMGERVAGRCRPCPLSALFFEFRFGFFEFLFFFLFTNPTVYVGMTETAFPLLFFRPACTTTGLVAFVLFLIIGFRDGIGSFLAAGVVVPYNVSDQSCNVARPDTEIGFTYARVPRNFRPTSSTSTSLIMYIKWIRSPAKSANLCCEFWQVCLSNISVKPPCYPRALVT